MNYIKTLCLALPFAIGALFTSAHANAAENKTIVVAESKATHRSSASHKHCHKRLRENRIVTICHKHRHWPLHHTKKRG